MFSSFIPRILIAGTSCKAGKSLLVLGLVVALRKRGLSVSCCVTGDALHQALIFSRLTRRYTRVLDRRLLSEGDLMASLYQAGLGADIVIIDGHGGLYDGVKSNDNLGSDAELAVLTNTPTVLLSELREASNSVAALVRGFTHFKGAPQIAALIANRVAPHAADPLLPPPVLGFLNECMDAYALPRFIGGLPETTLTALLPPSILSQKENFTALPMQFFNDVGNLVENHIDIDALIQIAGTAAPIQLQEPLADPQKRLCRFAVTDDSCFNICYQDNLDLLRYYGAEIVPFSPMIDNDLPRKIGGLYITGAYINSYCEELARNEQLRRSIKQFAEAGGVIYSEGAGTAYLCRSYQIEKGGPIYPGVGLIPAEAFTVQQPHALLEAELIDDSVLGLTGLKLRGTTTGEWGLRSMHAGAGGQVVNTMRIHIPRCSPVNEGYSSSAQTCSTFHFLHFGSNSQVAKSLVDAALVHERSKPPVDD